MLRLRSNWITTWVAPSVLVEVIWVTPAIWPNWRSSGAATEDAMVSALAPAKVAVTWMVGKSTCGKRRDRQKRKGGDPDERQRRHQEGGRDRPLDERLGEIHLKGSVQRPAASGQRLLPGYSALRAALPANAETATPPRLERRPTPPRPPRIEGGSLACRDAICYHLKQLPNAHL